MFTHIYQNTVNSEQRSAVDAKANRTRLRWSQVCLQLLVGGLISYLRDSCLFAHSGVQHILCCHFLWIVHFRLPLRYSLTFILKSPIQKIYGLHHERVDRSEIFICQTTMKLFPLMKISSIAEKNSEQIFISITKQVLFMRLRYII